MSAERSFDRNEFIVSKTNEKGIIQYANDVFLKVADYTEEEVLGKPHNLIRHPDMPRCVFKLLWERIQSGNEIFAYVINSTKFDDYYWVFAHVTPTFDDSGNITGFHSNRRVAETAPLETIKGLYKSLREEESKHSTPKAATEASYNLLMSILEEKGVDYDEFILTL